MKAATRGSVYACHTRKALSILARGSDAEEDAFPVGARPPQQVVKPRGKPYVRPARNVQGCLADVNDRQRRRVPPSFLLVFTRMFG